MTDRTRTKGPASAGPFLPRSFRCGKAEYATRRDAYETLVAILQAVMRGELHLKRIPVRAYRCPSSAAFHLTSQRGFSADDDESS